MDWVESKSIWGLRPEFAKRSPAALRVVPTAPELTAGLASFGIELPIGGHTGEVIRIAEGVADLEFSIRTHEMLKRWFGRALKLHIYLSVLLYLLLALHIGAGIHFGLRWLR